RVKYQLQTRLPQKLVRSVLKGQQYFADHEEYGRVFAIVDDRGELRPKQSSTLKDDRNALRQALAELDRLGAPDERKAELREEFDRAEPAVWIEVQPGYRIKRLTDWTDIGFQESLNDPMVGHEVPLGVAYLYLALCVRDAVYGDALAPVRHALQKAI